MDARLKLIAQNLNEATPALPPSMEQIGLMVERVRGLLFPQKTRDVFDKVDQLKRIHNSLQTLIGEAMAARNNRDVEITPNTTSVDFLRTLPAISGECRSDIQAALRGDPAAKDTAEVIQYYPGWNAVFMYRLAHSLLKLGVPYIPRGITEYAHQRTGIDIHPGATIGHGFFIDHGTGVVIGETANIGNDVKLYQGVTLGALSLPKDNTNKAVQLAKRHPTVEDRVIIYANATILGGDTTIGHDSVIGGNTWLKESVPPYSKVGTEQQKLIIKNGAPSAEKQ
jgi:serine O-acetyltransferase